MTPSATISSLQWNPPLSKASENEVPPGCQVDDVPIKYFKLDLGQPYTVIASATDAAYANFSIDGIVSLSEGSIFFTEGSSLIVSGTQLQADWSEGIGCAHFVFSGNVPWQRGPIDLHWGAGTPGEQSDQKFVLLVASVSLAPLLNNTAPASAVTTTSIVNTTATTEPKAIVSGLPTSGTTGATSASAASSHSSKKLAVLVAATLVPIVALFLAGFALLLFLRRRRRHLTPNTEPQPVKHHTGAVDDSEHPLMVEGQLQEEPQATVAHFQRKSDTDITPFSAPGLHSTSPTVRRKKRKFSVLRHGGDQTDTRQSISASDGSDSTAADTVDAGAMKELYRAMRSAGFTAHTLFEQLRRRPLEGNAVDDTATQLTPSDAPPTYESRFLQFIA